MTSRRLFLKTMTGAIAGGAVPQLAQAQESVPTCTMSRTVGIWTAVGGPAVAAGAPSSMSVSTFESGQRLQVFFYRRQPLYIASPEVTGPPSIVFAREQYRGVRDDMTFTMRGPWLTYQTTEETISLSEGFPQARQELEVIIDGRVLGVAERNNVRLPRSARDSTLAPATQFTMPGSMVSSFITGRQLTLNSLLDGHKVAETVVDLSQLGEALAMAEGLLNHKLETVGEDTVCQAPAQCVMTSAAVDMVGRADDCYELGQLRRLRGQFPDYRHVVDDYIAVSHQLLSGPRNRALQFALLVFYVLTVWPTALLVSLRAYQAAGRYYLAGFTMLKWVFRRRLT